jgi:hypothetical protein
MVIVICLEPCEEYLHCCIFSTQLTISSLSLIHCCNKYLLLYSYTCIASYFTGCLNLKQQMLQ